jgi:hypothetical protein
MQLSCIYAQCGFGNIDVAVLATSGRLVADEEGEETDEEAGRSGVVR